MHASLWNPRRLVILTASLALGWAVAQMVSAADHPEPKPADGWIALVDGDQEDLSKWTTKKGNWVIEDGLLARRSGGGYIWTKEEFGDFVLDLEVKMSDGCNSGVFFRTNPKNPVQDGFEIQVLDSHGKENPNSHDFGALYDAKAPSKNVCRAPGEWNRVTLECRGPMITVVANGETVVELNIDDWDTAHRNPDGSQNKFNRPLKKFPRKGHIGFQDHGHPVWYRNVWIKPL